MAAGLHISISAETIAHFGEFSFTNSMLASVVVSALLILIALFFKSTYQPSKSPKGFHNMIEMIIEGLYGMVKGVAQSEKKTQAFFPYIATFFIFICVNNWFGLLPGVGTIGFYEEVSSEHGTATESSIVSQVHASEPIVVPADEHGTVPVQIDNSHTESTGESLEEDSHSTETTKVFVPYLRAGTADLNMTLALALISQIMVQIFGFKYIGAGYLKKFFQFSNPIMTFVGLLELLGEFTKVVSYAFRLFGNVFAGEVLLIVITYLTKVVVPMPFYGLELFVGLVQALVFAMLSLVFFNTATISHDEEH